MTRRILLTSLIVLLSGGLLGSYFYFTGQLVTQGQRQARCRQVDVILLDSLESHIVDREEIFRLLARQSLGQPIDSIDLHKLESQVRSLGEVVSAQVFTADDRTLAVVPTYDALEMAQTARRAGTPTRKATFSRYAKPRTCPWSPATSRFNWS